MNTPEQFQAEVKRVKAELAKDRLPGPLAEAGRLWHQRCLDSSHLVAAPELWLWREGELIHARWQSPPSGAHLWVPAAGALTMPVAQFVDELHAFDQAFMAEMGERVQSIRRAGGMPGVTIDLNCLATEQEDRATWLDKALSRPRRQNWDATRQLIDRFRPHH